MTSLVSNAVSAVAGAKALSTTHNDHIKSTSALIHDITNELNYLNDGPTALLTLQLDSYRLAFKLVIGIDDNLKKKQ